MKAAARAGTVRSCSEGVTALVVALREAARRGHEVCVEITRESIVHRVLAVCGLPFAVIED